MCIVDKGWNEAKQKCPVIQFVCHKENEYAFKSDRWVPVAKNMKEVQAFYAGAQSGGTKISEQQMRVIVKKTTLCIDDAIMDVTKMTTGPLSIDGRAKQCLSAKVCTVKEGTLKTKCHPSGKCPSGSEDAQHFTASRSLASVCSNY